MLAILLRFFEVYVSSFCFNGVLLFKVIPCFLGWVTISKVLFADGYRLSELFVKHFLGVQRGTGVWTRSLIY